MKLKLIAYGFKEKIKVIKPENLLKFFDILETLKYSNRYKFLREELRRILFERLLYKTKTLESFSKDTGGSNVQPDKALFLNLEH